VIVNVAVRTDRQMELFRSIQNLESGKVTKRRYKGLEEKSRQEEMKESGKK
jgi:hypothetical protein